MFVFIIKKKYQVCVIYTLMSKQEINQPVQSKWDIRDKFQRGGCWSMFLNCFTMRCLLIFLGNSFRRNFIVKIRMLYVSSEC